MSRPVSRDTERLRRSVRTVAVLYGLSASLVICALAFGESPTWKVFSNRAGWSVDYPSDWTIGSCRSCKDPTAPEVFVDFFPPTDSDSGWVMIERLADKPSGMAVDTWLEELKQTANLNPRLKEQRFTVHDIPALSVRYRNPHNGGEEMESVYVVSGTRTFEIQFDGEKPGISLEKFGNYSIFLQMVKSFRVKP
jgi:hypothetical protein